MTAPALDRSRALLLRRRLGRTVPTLADLRAALVREHPSAARCRAGGRGRLLPLAQILADWCTPKGQALVAQVANPAGLAENVALRERLYREGAARWQGARDAARERELVCRRAEALDALEALAARWAREDEARARRAA